MTESEIRKLLERQRTFFSTGKTLPVSFRLRQLEKLKRSIQKNEPLLRHALKKDLGKSNMESYMCEIGLTLSELSWMQRHVRSLAKKPDCTNASLPVCRPQLPFSYPIWDRF